MVTSNDPLNARMAKTERRRVALSAMLQRLAKGADVAEELLEHETPEIRLRAIHALTQCATTYAKVYEVGELEYRFELLEQWQREHAGAPAQLPAGVESFNVERISTDDDTTDTTDNPEELTS